jgi:hypothetical protein
MQTIILDEQSVGKRDSIAYVLASLFVAALMRAQRLLVALPPVRD